MHAAGAVNATNATGATDDQTDHLMRPRGTATRCGRNVRPVIAVLGGLLGLVLAASATGVAAAQESTTRGIDRVCPVPDEDEPLTFDDVGEPHAPAVSCAATYGIISGYADGTYGPGQPITRAQMASLVLGWVEQATGISLPQPDEQRFDDVDGTHADSIEALAEAGIVAGRDDHTFAPRETLTRGQFTGAVVNAISYADVFSVDGPLPPDGDGGQFDDVVDTTFEDEINALAGIGVTGGVAEGLFAPNQPVTRGQLATFLMRAADYLDEHQRWLPTARTSVVQIAELEAVPGLEPDPDDGDDADDTTDDGDATDADDADDPPRGSATLTINAFNGTLAYTLDLSQAPGPYGGDGATIRLGELDDPDAQLVLRLASPDELDDSTGGVVTGVVFESDSAMRFAELIEAPQDAFVQVAIEGAPGGVVRGQLHGTAG